MKLVSFFFPSIWGAISVFEIEFLDLSYSKMFELLFAEMAEISFFWLFSDYRDWSLLRLSPSASMCCSETNLLPVKSILKTGGCYSKEFFTLLFAGFKLPYASYRKFSELSSESKSQFPSSEFSEDLSSI